MKKLAYARQDGKVSIVTPAPKADIEKVLGPLTDEEYKNHVKERSIPQGVTTIEIDDAALPSDREFRDAWKMNGDKIDYDLTVAKEMQLARVRAARTPFLEELDTQFMLAVEKGDEAKRQQVADEKQRLRDITNPIKALTPTSIEDVKNAFPQELKGKAQPCRSRAIASRRLCSIVALQLGSSFMRCQFCSMVA